MFFGIWENKKAHGVNRMFGQNIKNSGQTADSLKFQAKIKLANNVFTLFASIKPGDPYGD